ncbi:MAG: GntR family transcriptional regulator [Betaproteobacteria bacterium]|nr:GntR family transcriptional regulator [Betaproteobacteria bacterium]
MANPRKNSSQDKAYSHIKDEIVSLSAKPGSPLRAQEIAAHLDVSRTPVREALSRLEQEGFVMRQDGWGYVVRPMTPQDILNLFTVRESLEVQAALEALPHLNGAVLSALAVKLEKAARLLKQERYAVFRALSREFHLSIAAASHNELLYRLLATARDRILLVGAMHQDMRSSRAREVQAENTKILKALRSGDPELVKDAVLAHIRASRASILPAGIVNAVDEPAVQARKPAAKRATRRRR